MLTPIEIQNRNIKTGMGYRKKETDDFFDEILKDYEQMYKENVELKDKLNVLTEAVQYYKNMETTLQNALVLAEKTSEETKHAADKHACAIEKEAKASAKLILADAKNELSRLQAQKLALTQEYEKFKVHFKSLMETQMKFFESECFSIEKLTDFKFEEEENESLDVNTEEKNLQKEVGESHSQEGNLSKKVKEDQPVKPVMEEEQNDLDDFEFFNLDQYKD
jgi:Cell division initiation protein